MKKVIAKQLTYLLNYIYQYFASPNYVNCKGVKLHIGKNKFTRKVVRAFHKGSYEQEERNILVSTLSPEDTYLEIGAGVGYMGINAAKIVNSNDQIFLFEANPEMVEVIKVNMKLNSQKLSVFNKAVISGDDKEVSFYLAKHFWASSTLNKRGTNRITVDALSMENMLRIYQP